MKLDKKEKSVIVIYVIVLFVYVFTFLIVPFHKAVASWIAFVFTIVALISSLLISSIAFKSRETVISQIYGLPIFRVGVIYVITQFIIGVIICSIATFVAVPYWLVLLLSVILLGVALIGVIVTDNTRDMIEVIDESVKIETKNVTYFQINIAGIVDNCKNYDVKSELETLNNLFKFSDPVTNEATKEIEETIKVMIDKLKVLVADGSTEDIKLLIEELTNTLNQRNRICKANKR